MADEDEQNESGEIKDGPAARAEAFLERIGGVPSNVYRVIADAQAHAQAAPADPGAPGWTPLGPRNVGGAIRSLAQDPQRPAIWYAGSAQGGLWKTDDDGATWSSIGSPLMMTPVGAVAVSPTNSLFVYAGTGEPRYGSVGGSGLFRSKDGGVSFDRLVDASGSTGSAEQYGRIVVDPLVPQRCWAASFRGLFRFEDSSATVEQLPGVAAGTAVSDVALTRDPGDPDKYVLLAGVVGAGIFRGVYSRDADETVWTAATLAPTAGIGRIKVAFSGTKVGVTATPWAYAIMEDLGFSGAVAAVQQYPTVVFQSKDFGASWPPRPSVGAVPAAVSPEPPPPAPPLPETNTGSADYALAIAVDPRDPTRVLVGNVNLFASVNEGRTFTTIIDWLNHSAGKRAEHGDQHQIVFDVRAAAAASVWSANDGGVSYTADGGANWQKRSYGILAAQLTDITTHPNFPFIFGGGMQDNGTFVSFGGPTWYLLSEGDGGQMVFTPSAAPVAPAPPVFVRSYITSTQANIRAVSIAAGVGTNSTTLPDLDSPGNVMQPLRTDLILPGGKARAMFIGVVEGDGITPNRLLVGRKNSNPPGAVAGFYSTDGSTVAALTTPGLTGDVTVVKFVENAPDAWLGTSTGMLFTLAGSPAVPPVTGPAWTARPLPGAARAISSIAVHPTNRNVVAVSTMGNPGSVFLSHDAGATWSDASGTGSDQLSTGPALCVVFHPTDPKVLFAGTLGGVSVIRNLPAPGAPAAVPAFDPEWKTYNNGLPLVQVNDLSVTPVALTLRCATFGRGAFECNIDGATPAGLGIPSVRLSIREHVSDDGRSYPAASLFFDDPRLPAVAAPAPTDFNHTRAIDVRIDAPPFAATQGASFGTPLDGAEFDETLVSDPPLVGETNHVYVQVHNRGSSPAFDAEIHLYFANAGKPPAAPAISADLNFPLEPAEASAWQRAAPSQRVVIQPGQPHVARFAWVPPLRVRDNVALLAICSNGGDPVPAVPAGDTVAFVSAERRAALRITPVRRDAVFIRDGVDDNGFVGSVAWGGRSPDIIVRQAAVANPDDPAGELADPRDPHLADRVRPGNNFIYVRVWNRTEVNVDARVQVYRVPHPELPTLEPADLVGGPVNVAAIPPRAARFATIPWNGVTDPDAANAYKAFALVAVASVLDAGVELDPFPDLTSVVDVDSFWRFGLSAPLANNAALRALRFDPNP